MREIKFRAWSIENKNMVPWFQVSHESLKVINEDKEMIWMQFTGLLDKNGKEIYEGDIVKSPKFKNQMTVEYTTIQASDDMTAPGIGFQFNTYPEEMEIIGNIYENPELV